MDTQTLYDYENDPSHWKLYSFSGGPTQLPRYVAHKIQREFLSLGGSGISILETSQNTKQFHEILNQANDDLRSLYDIPSDFKIIFCAGGGTIVFDALPMNFLKGKTTASYVNTGYWSNRAVNEAKILCPNLHFPTSIQRNQNGQIQVPELNEWSNCEDSAYLHYCDNETVEGLEYPFIPKFPGVPLVSDMSSNFLTKNIDWSKQDIVYAHAQKNIGVAGSAIVIVRESLVDKKKLAMTPYMCDLEEMIKQQSLINTVPIYPIYVNQQVFSWMKNFGSINYWEDIMNRRPKPIYDIIDSSHGLYRCIVANRWRSRINISFTLPTQNQTDDFLKHCEEQGLIELNGHRSIGGCRISLYVPVPQIGINKLSVVMQEYMENIIQ